jgi:hypothetical protein
MMNNNVFEFQQSPELVHLVTVKRMKEMDTSPPTLKRLQTPQEKSSQQGTLGILYEGRP